MGFHGHVVGYFFLGYLRWFLKTGDCNPIKGRLMEKMINHENEAYYIFGQSRYSLAILISWPKKTSVFEGNGPKKMSTEGTSS